MSKFGQTDSERRKIITRRHMAFIGHKQRYHEVYNACSTLGLVAEDVSFNRADNRITVFCDGPQDHANLMIAIANVPCAHVNKTVY